MKWLFMLLVALNIGFFAWQFQNIETKSTAVAQTDLNDKTTRLILLRELDVELNKMALPDNPSEQTEATASPSQESPGNLAPTAP